MPYMPMMPGNATLVELAVQITRTRIGPDYTEQDVRDTQEQIDDACVAYWPYTSDGPGYRGPVIVVIWPAGPGEISVFTQDEGGLWVERAGPNGEGHVDHHASRIFFLIEIEAGGRLVSVPYDRVANLLVSAFEGGSNYWAQIVVKTPPTDPAHWYRAWGDSDNPPYVDFPLSKTGSITLRVPLDDEGSKTMDVTLDRAAIIRGLRLMANAEKCPPRHWHDFMRENDDADTADVFLQLAVLGEITFS